MASFPTALDDFSNHSAGDSLTGISHASRHADVNDAVEAVEAKVGTGASTPTLGKVLTGTGTGTSGWGDAVVAVDGLTSLGSGDAIDMWGEFDAQVLSVRKGTSASPDTTGGPLVKVERTVNVNESEFSGDGADAMSGLAVVVKSQAASTVQPVAIMGMAYTYGTTAGSHSQPDSCGVYGVGQSLGSLGTGIGGVFSGIRWTDTTGATALELSSDNRAAAGSYNSTGYSKGQGIWLNAWGTADSAVGIVFGNAHGMQFKVGIGFTAQVTSAVTGGVADASIRDDSSSSTSIDIRGAHALGIDMTGTFSSAAIKLPNLAIIRWRNGANDASHNLIQYGSGNGLALGTDATSLQFKAPMTVTEAKDISFGTTTGSKIGTATTQKIGFYNATPVVQPSGVAVTAEGIHAALVTLGLIAA